jgi:hypothetical protein
VVGHVTRKGVQSLGSEQELWVVSGCARQVLGAEVHL